VTDGVAVAVFATGGRCDEAVALNAGTGVRAWTRSVGFAGDVRLSSTRAIVLASNPGGIVVLDPTGDSSRWRYAVPGGCRLIGAAAGDTGVAVLEHCNGADGVQVRLFGGFEGERHWARDLPVAEADADDTRLLGADGAVTVLLDGKIQVLAPANGALLSRLPAPGDPDGIAQRAAGGVALVLVHGQLSALDPATGDVLWATPAIGLPTASSADKQAEEPASLLVPAADGFVRRDPTTGTELGRSAVTGLPEGGVASALGPVVVYRLDDRVIAYR
jgi:outer membrane protein assembly factor BamB